MKKYIEAELEVIAFDAEDVIATSLCPEENQQGCADDCDF